MKKLLSLLTALPLVAILMFNTFVFADTGDIVVEGKPVTGKIEVGGGTLEFPNSDTLPGTCVIGDTYILTDAASGRQCYVCESANVWTPQGSFYGAAYFPDYNEADQGVTGNGKSAKAYIDTISTDSATLIFRHNSGAATTTYTFSTSETIPSNINIIIEKGAIFSIAAAQTLTNNGPFDVGLYQVFSGSGSIVFGTGAITEAYPQWWGGVGDGVADDTISIQKAIDCVEAYFESTESVIKLKIPQGKYLISGLDVGSRIRIEGEGYKDTIFITTSNAPIITYEQVAAHYLPLRFIVSGIGFEGNHVLRGGSVGKENQDGIRVTVGSVPNTMEVSHCSFSNLNGYGINLVGAATYPSIDEIRIHDNIMYFNGYFGIRTVNFISSIHIENNEICTNGGGIKLDHAALVSILHNVIEGNTTGVNGADVGGAGKPAVGVYLDSCTFIFITDNHFEYHLNDVYSAGGCNSIYFTNNYSSGGSNMVPEDEYTAHGGSNIIRQLSPVYSNAGDTGFVIRENQTYTPTKPATTAAGVWDPDTLGWGDSYPTYPSLPQSQYELVRNGTHGASGRKSNATFDQSGKDRVYFEGVDNIGAGDIIEKRENIYSSIKAIGLNNRYDAYKNLVKHQYLWPLETETIDSYHNFRGGTYATDDTIAEYGTAFSITPVGVIFPSGVILGASDTQYRISYGNAAPTTGAHHQGAIIFKMLPAAGGRIGWVCTVTGTFGGQNQAGTTTTGSKIITGIADTSGFNIGDYISVSAGFAATSQFVVSKTSSTITVRSSATSSGATNVTTTNPTFKEWGDIQA